MVKINWGLSPSGIGITWGGNKLWGYSFEFYLLFLMIEIQLTKGKYGVADGE